jgi:hypothetical protein
MVVDIENFRWDKETQIQSRKIKRVEKKSAGGRRRKGLFLGTPIPMSWLHAAGNLPGKTLHVAVALWFAHGVSKSSRIKFTPRWYKGFDIGPKALRESLHRLRAAGLIGLEYRPGSSPIVTILDAPEESTPGQ